MANHTITELVSKLRKAKTAGRFTTFIDFIQFPKYRCLATGARIDFSFPLTVLIGQNGTGKTSVLQALSGAPEGTSVGKHWFGTAVDPIDDGAEAALPESGVKQKFQGERSAFWYGYHQGDAGGLGNQLEAVKTRIWRKDDADYWEPSRPIKSYGMKLLPGKARSPQIKMLTNYLSMRFNLNAFDRCFHFSADSTLRVFRRSVWEKKGRSGKPSVQDYLRHRSRRLKDAITKQAVIQAGNSVMNEVPRALTAEEVRWIGEIIGKQYTSGTIIDHRFYETNGRSVLLTTASHSYSEAFAGSGESLVVNLVIAVLAAPDHSLLLLDEPETSLHPGAQRKLLGFLLEQTLQKKLQVVVSTHTSELVRDLPSEAIKVFRPGFDGTIQVEQGLSWDEAFFVIGQQLEPRIHVIVEDMLAASLVNEALQSVSDTFSSQFRVEHRPGGESRMKQDIALSITTSHSRPIFLFDGDQTPAPGVCDPGDLKQTDITPDNLNKLIQQQTGQKISFHENSNMSAEQKSDIRMKFLQYYKQSVHFLPFATPEAAIWNPDVCESFLTTILRDVGKAKAETKAIQTKDSKDRYAFIADKYRLSIESVHQVFVLAFANGESAEWDSLKTQLKTIAASNNA